jgi:hypothetical protein
MEILLLPEPVNGLVAWEVQLGDRESQFLMAEDGSVLYRNPYADRDWVASPSRERFVAAAEAWNRYNQSIKGKSEHEHPEIVKTLRHELTAAGALDGDPGSFWELLLEQAEDGFL